MDSFEVERVLTVSQLNALARDLIESSFSHFWIQGEISGISKSRLGHCYFILKDQYAQVSCALFRYKQFSFQPKEGAEVRLRGRVSLYEARGTYQIVVEQIEPIGLGKLYLEYVELKAKLQEKGYFAAEQKKKIPKFPKRIGIITSPSGAVLRDILTTLKRRMSNIEVILYPTPVQGEGSGEQIANAIDIASMRNEVDVLILARGGGSLEDLWAFNTEKVVESIYRCNLPIISAVGHEMDITLSDFVADLRAPTPTGAAELASPNWADLLGEVQNSFHRLKVVCRSRFDEFSQRLDTYQRLLILPQRLLQEKRQVVTHYLHRLTQELHNVKMSKQLKLEEVKFHSLVFRSGVERYAYQLKEKKQQLGQELRRQLKYKQVALETTAKRLNTVYLTLRIHRWKLNHLNKLYKDLLHIKLERSQERWIHGKQVLKLLSLSDTLRRGYSVVTDTAGTILTSSERLSKQQPLEIQFARGKANVIVTSSSD
ncbi:MAG: exodeoxyribonuclease VII large subunit [Neisseriaceae bacterium]